MKKKDAKVTRLEPMSEQEREKLMQQIWDEIFEEYTDGNEPTTRKSALNPKGY